MDSKRCAKCNIEKTIDEYCKSGKKKNGDIRYHSYCKAFQIKYRKQQYEQNKEQILTRNKQYNQKNKEQISTQKKQYNKKNKERINAQKIQYKKHRRSNDIEFKLIDNTRNRINHAIRSQLTKKSARTHDLLGIPMDKYIRWIEFQLKDDYTWDNWGTDFHIDHVYPISKHDLSKKEEQFKAFNWKNTRPLCKKKMDQRAIK